MRRIARVLGGLILLALPGLLLVWATAGGALSWPAVPAGALLLPACAIAGLALFVLFGLIVPERFLSKGEGGEGVTHRTMKDGRTVFWW